MLRSLYPPVFTITGLDSVSFHLVDGFYPNLWHPYFCIYYIIQAIMPHTKILHVSISFLGKITTISSTDS